MLIKIHRIKGIGLLHDADGRQHSLKKASLIYADNGAGKSTLASIFRSCALDKPDLILRRRTIDGSNQPEVHLQFSNGNQTRFDNANWSSSHPELLVFDADFVEQNVYTGGQVTSDQRRNLLKFALGAHAVNAQHEYDQANSDALASAQLIRDLTNQLAVYHGGTSLQEFRELEEVSDVDTQIARLKECLVQAQNISRIHSKSLPRRLVEPSLDISHIFDILAKSLTEIDLAAEQHVRQHMASHTWSDLEKWISDGHANEDAESCPYCGQPLDGIELIQAYRSYFNQDYSQLKKSVADLDRLISISTSEAIAERLNANFSTAAAIIEGWQEHVEIATPRFDHDGAKTVLTKMKDRLDDLRRSKEARLLESIGSSEEKSRIIIIWNDLIDIVRSCNNEINNAITLIELYKAGLTAVNSDELERDIQRLEMIKTRYREEVVDLIVRLDLETAREATARAEKQNKKDNLNAIMGALLGTYKDRINNLLQAFGAQFSIQSMDFNYRGGLRSDYSLHMRGANIELSGGIPDFKTALSEGDKRTLAFAFFIASVESEPDIGNKIIVIDDPMCSLDLNRKQQTRSILKRIHSISKQLIVLVHDIHFMRNLRKDLLRTSSPQDVSCLKLKTVANRYSTFDSIDVNKECEGGYFRCHRVLGEYLEGSVQSSMEVAKSIRPMLEGYLHRRFPGIISRDLMFGDVIRAINNAHPGSPLAHAQNITSELSEINAYAGQYHHDTDPGADPVEIIDGELRSFVERAIKVVHSGLA